MRNAVKLLAIGLALGTVASIAPALAQPNVRDHRKEPPPVRRRPPPSRYFGHAAAFIASQSTLLRAPQPFLKSSPARFASRFVPMPRSYMSPRRKHPMGTPASQALSFSWTARLKFFGRGSPAM